MIETYFADYGLAPGVRELVGLKGVVKAPFSLKALECLAIGDSHPRANWKLLNVWLRHQRTPSSAERHTVHMRAVCPEGAGRSASHGVRRRSNVMATLTLALVRCYGLFCRAFPGHAADPGQQFARTRDRHRFCGGEHSTRPPARARSRLFSCKQSRGAAFVASGAFAPRRLRIRLALSKSCLREARGSDGRASAERYTVHLRAVCPKRGRALTRREAPEGV